MLTRIENGCARKPPRLLLYGGEGIGKSTFGAGTPKPIFIQTEDGLDEIDTAKFPLAASFEEVTAALDELAREPHEFETVVVDSVDWLERLIWDRVCRDAGVSGIEKADGGYGKGYLTALGHWRDVVAKLNVLRQHRGMVVVLIAHAKVERFEDPESSPYDRFAPRLNKHSAALLCEWCDAVLFATRKIRTQTEDAGFNRKRTVAHALGRDGGERVLRCVGGPSCVAKNRFGLTEELPLSWAAFVTALSSQQRGVPSHG
jgi:hypothetical protein